jgi:menaquinone-dependent protoporphyrinogen IX oxidase
MAGNKILVLYDSKYGSTKKYAEWICQDLGCDIFEVKKFDNKLLKNYETVVFGCGLYAGKIAVKNAIIKNFALLKDKKTVLFTVGLADVSNEKNVQAIKERISKEIGEKIYNEIAIFHFRGAINYGELSFIHKQMMNMLHAVVKKKAGEFDAQEKEFMETFGKTVDFTDKNSISPLVNFCKTA